MSDDVRHLAVSFPPRTVLRGIGQIVLQPNAATGLLLFAALVSFDRWLACAALIGIVTALAVASVSDHRDDNAQLELDCVNGALAALAAFSLIGARGVAIAVAVFAAALATCLSNPLRRWLRAGGLSPYTSPFVFATWFWLPLAAAPHSASTDAPFGAMSHAPSFAQFAGDIVRSFGQIVFAPGMVSGGLVWIGIAIASRRSACYALLASALATGVPLLTGGDATLLGHGLLGFNAALAALALADRGLWVALGGAMVAALFQHAASCIGWPMLTAPFVAATWAIRWERRPSQQTGRAVEQ